MVKKLLCVMVSICVLLGCSSCGNMFRQTQTSESQSESQSQSQITPIPTDIELNFEINVTNSLDIVPDGVGVLDVIRPSVVEIYCTLTNGTSSGSGVVLSLTDSDEDGENDKAVIVTCEHVIEGASAVTVKAIDGKEYSTLLVGADPETDIAVLYVEATADNKFENLSPATWYDRSADLKVGTEVYAIGNPLGTLGGTVTSGIISAINRDVLVEGREMTLIQTDAAINSGNSGGGLFDKATGALLGIVNAGYASATAQGLNFAIPGSLAIDIIEQLVANGYIEGRYKFGVELGAFSSRSGEYYIGIYSLESDGLFYKNGFKAEDLITSIKIGNRTKLSLENLTYSTVENKLDELYAYLDSELNEIGDTVTVEYSRYVTGSGYVDKTATFTISQYVYQG
ncbi:MAG: trypsin-like peptidase domain-containing protein [Clostridia bacterium]|nr:trypsin-like peptidase domain-containing protein [Clostridia bacterium]